MSKASYLQLSTANMPGPDAEFGPFRSSDSEHGAIVWVMDAIEVDRIPIWFHPVYELALKQECSLIEFDCDNEAHPDLPKYDW